MLSRRYIHRIDDWGDVGVFEIAEYTGAISVPARRPSVPLVGIHSPLTQKDQAESADALSRYNIADIA
jgi:hypothetical protein